MPKVFHPVARADEIEPGELKYVEVGDRAICLANVGGEILALDNACTHEGASLSEGTLSGTRLEWPGSRRRLRSLFRRAAAVPRGPPGQDLFCRDRGRRHLGRHQDVMLVRS